MSEHFARVTPIIGTSLQSKRIAVYGILGSESLIDYLAASGICKWAVDLPESSCQQISAQLQARHGPTLTYDIQPHTDQPSDLQVWINTTSETYQHASLWIQPPSLQQAGQISSHPIPIQPTLPDKTRWQRSIPLAAQIVRAYLLRNTPYHLIEMYNQWETLNFWFEHPGDPGRIWYNEPSPWQSNYGVPSNKRGHILIAGVGSLGSEAAIQLAPQLQQLTLVDPDVVDMYNPVRQAFLQHDIGLPKVEALAQRLYPQTQVHCYQQELTAQRLHQLCATNTIDAALIVTGTARDYELAEVLYNQGIPHLVGRCYPRAQYWEAIIVDPHQATEQFANMRSHIQRGPSAPLTPEQRAAYSEEGALEAEPATLIESGWAANWMSSLVYELQLPSGLRSRYLLEWINAKATCILGAMRVFPTPNGPAYSITDIGSVKALQRSAIRQPVAPSLPKLPQQSYWQEDS